MKAIIGAIKSFIAIGSAFAVPIPPSPIAISAKAAFTVRIVDEETGDGMMGMMVVCPLPSSKNIFGDLGYTVVTNFTDKSGEVRLAEKIYDDEIQCFVMNLGRYYPLPGMRIQFTNMTESLVKKWLPYDEIQTITLQKIGKKIPLFVKEARPKRNQDLTTAPDRKFGYDLVKGDWMPPFGKGEHVDIDFKLLPRENFGMGMGPSGIPDPAFRDTVQVKFVGKDNGIVKVTPPPGAVLKVRTAPKGGYLSKFNIWFGQTKTMQDDTNIDKEACHAFRVRTIRNAKGEIVSALFGKIYGDFRFTYKYSLIPTGVSFTYYLNLTPNDRNLEWDMKHNLCPVRNSFNRP